MQMRVFGIVTCLLFLGAGCTASEEFPVIERDLEMGEQGFFVCSEVGTGARVYKQQTCGDDSCFQLMYDVNGSLIEEGEFGFGAMRSAETKLDDCERTTEEYFSSKVTGP